MRRKSYGVIRGDHIVPARIAKAESHDASYVIEKLEPIVLERRKERLLEVIGSRLESVQVVFDAPHDPHNGAAVVRSCEAFGVQYVNVVERYEGFLLAGTVSRGAEKWIDLRRYKKAEEVVTKLRAEGYTLVAAAADGDLAPADLASIPRLALILGNERDGIADDLVAACERRVRVPMRGFVESLNVSVSAAILLAAATAGRKGDLSEPERRRLYARGLYFSYERADDVLALAPHEH